METMEAGNQLFLIIIANKIRIKNMTLGNSNEYFASYVEKCGYTINKHLPEDSTFIRSEDIMEQIVVNRKEYERAVRGFRKTSSSMKDYGIKDDFVANLFDNPDEVTNSQRFFMSRHSGLCSAVTDIWEVGGKQMSNGEKALEYFKDHFFTDTLYLLDEPENSMAPTYQSELAKMIAILAYRLNTQFVSATHSPFLLSIQGARIYDLDSHLSIQKEWYKLANMRIYYELFYRFRKKFGCC